MWVMWVMWVPYELGGLRREPLFFLLRIQLFADLGLDF
jgi:hypothetical protein